MTEESEAEGKEEKYRTCASVVEGERELWVDLSQEDQELENGSNN
jgi:hypothetical protein